MKSGSLNFLQPSGPLQACNGTALPFTHVHLIAPWRHRDVWYEMMNSYRAKIYQVRPVAWVCGRSLCLDCGFESLRWHGCVYLVSVVCSQVEVSESSWSLVQKSPTECAVSECDHKTSTMRSTRSTRAVELWNKNKNYQVVKEAVDGNSGNKYCQMPATFF